MAKGNRKGAPATTAPASAGITERALTALADLREATREGRETLADLGAMEKRMRALKAEVEEVAGTIFAERMEEHVKAAMEQWNESTQEAIKQTEVAIDRRFDAITSILLGEGRREGPTIAEMAQQVRDQMEAERGEPTT